MSDPTVEAQNLAEELTRLRAEERGMERQWFPNKEHQQAVRKRIREIVENLGEVTTKPLTEEALSKVFSALHPGASVEDRAIWMTRVSEKQRAFSNVPDLTGKINPPRDLGSRGNVAEGYFPTTNQRGEPVVLFRGRESAGEQAKLLSFLDDLAKRNPAARAMLPEVYGRVTIDGKTYLVMENLTKNPNGIVMKGTDIASGLTRESFLAQHGNLFTPEFRARIEGYEGLNIGRTTLEKDYLFVQPDGRIRMGIPFRASDFTQEAQKMFALAPAETVPTESHTAVEVRPNTAPATDAAELARASKAETLAKYGADLFEHPAVTVGAAEALAHSAMLAKFAGGAAKVLKIAAPVLITYAIAEQAKMADLAAAKGEISASACLQYKALIATGLTAGAFDPTFGPASDAGLNEAIKAWGKANNIPDTVVAGLNCSLSALANKVALTPEQQRFFDHYSALPATVDPSNPPEINRLIELKQKIEQNIAEASKPVNPTEIGNQGPAAKARYEELLKLKSEYAEAYIDAAKKDPKFLSSLDQSAVLNNKAVELAKDRKLQDEANRLIDTLPEKADPSLSPQTNRLIAARDALRDRIAELDKAEKADMAAGRPVLGYYGKKIDEAVQTFAEAVAREKIVSETTTPAVPETNPVTSLERYRATRKPTPSVATLKTEGPAEDNHPAKKTGATRETGADQTSPALRVANNGHVAGPV